MMVAVLIVPAAPLSSRAEEPPRATAPAGQAAERAQRLDALFARLGSTKDEVEGETIVEEIWRVWLQSGRPEIDGLMEQAQARIGIGDMVTGLALLDTIIERAPDWAEGWNKRATLLYMLDAYDRSLADIDRVLALEPRHFGALAGRGLIHIAREEYKAALEDYRRALAVNPFLKGAEVVEVLERKTGERPL